MKLNELKNLNRILETKDGRAITCFNVYKELNNDIYYSDISESIRQEYMHYELNVTEQNVIALQQDEINKIASLIDDKQIKEIWLASECLFIAIK